MGEEFDKKKVEDLLFRSRLMYGIRDDSEAIDFYNYYCFSSPEDVEFVEKKYKEWLSLEKVEKEIVTISADIKTFMEQGRTNFMYNCIKQRGYLNDKLKEIATQSPDFIHGEG